jgi:hypothetical protein
MKVKKKYLSPIVTIAIAWYSFCAVWLYLDRNEHYVDDYHFHSRSLIRHIAENGKTYEDAISLLREIEEKGKNPIFDFNVSTNKGDPNIWCVTAIPRKESRYLGGIKGILLGLNFRKVYYSPSVAFRSSDYNRLYGRENQAGVVIVGYHDGSEMNGISDSTDIFEFLNSAHVNDVVVFPSNETEIEPVAGINSVTSLRDSTP